MHNLRAIRSVMPLLLFAALPTACSPSVIAAEPVRPFVDALIGRQYFDQALDYLDSLANSPLVDDAFKESLDYETAQVLIQSAAGTSDRARREQQLDQAEARLNRFVDARVRRDLLGAARLQLANVLAERGRGLLHSAKLAAGVEASQLQIQGKEFLEQAQKKYIAAHAVLLADLAQLPKPALIDPADLQTKQRKQQLQRDIARAELLLANVEYELAQNESDPTNRRRGLQATAESYGRLFEAYRTIGTGLYAHYWQGRCYQELGDHRRALACYLDLIELPDAEPEARLWQTKSLRQAMEIWTDPKQGKYGEAIKRGEKWLESDRAGSGKDADALAIRYFLAVARQAESTETGSKPSGRSKQLAKKLVAQVASYPGEYQKPAKLLLVKLGGKGNDDAESKNFAEAYQAAVDSFDTLRATAVGLKIAEENGDQEAIAELQQSKQQQLETTQQTHRIAFSMAQGAKPDELATLRSNLAYLKWEAGELYDAAVLGEFLAKAYPDSAMGRQGARIAMEAFAKIYAESKAEDKSFEEAQVRRIAEYILKRWPDQEDAEYASLKLLHFALADRQLERAEEYLKQIPAESPRRAAIELRFAQALWASYLQQSSAPIADRRPQGELDAIKSRAQSIFEGAIQKLETGGASATLAAAILSLAQIYLDASQPAKAIEWLEKDAVGPLKLVQGNSPLVQQEGFAVEAYKAALRAYIAVQPQQLEKAESVMTALESRIEASGDAKANETLTLIYISLGRELQRQLQELRSSGKRAELELVSKGFEIFLDRVAKRDTGASFSSLNWVAETYYSLGTGFDDGAAKIPTQARTYFERAAETYQKILKMVEQQPSLAEGDALLGIRLRLAVSLRRSGEYQQALNLLASVLGDNKNNLTAQVQAAETYQAQGDSKPDAYVNAIAGGMPDEQGNNLIWGWAKLSKLTMNNDKLASTFHDARLKLAEARFKYGLKQKVVKDRRRHVEGAKQELWITYKLYPQLGGAEFQPQYERLLKRIQNSLDEKDVGLKEFQDRASESASAEKKAVSST
jgi:hypothetical protein